MAGRIPEEFINDLIERADIVDVVGRSLPLRRAGQEFSACCPFHDEKTPSFFISPRKQFYHCFGCGATGSVLSFLMAFHNLDFREAVEMLAEQQGMEIPVTTPAPQAITDRREQLRTALERAGHFFSRNLRQHPAAATATAYLKQRGLTGEVARDFGLGFAPPGWTSLVDAMRAEISESVLIDAGLAKRREDGSLFDMFRNRIMFPIQDARGRLIGFGGRAIGDDKPKYLNSPETPLFQKGRELYRLDRARREAGRTGQILVVEGYMDVIALAQFGIQHAVATLGTAATEEHCEKLFRSSNDVVFCFDGDSAGQRAARRAAETCLPLLRDGRWVGFRFLPTGEDPDSLVRKQGPGVFEGRTGVTPIAEYVLESLCAETEVDSMAGRARLVASALPLLNRLPPGALKAMMLDRLSELARTRREDLERVAEADRTARQPNSRRRPDPAVARQNPDDPAVSAPRAPDEGPPWRSPPTDRHDPRPRFVQTSAASSTASPPRSRLIERALQIATQLPECRSAEAMTALSGEVAGDSSLEDLILLLNEAPAASTGQLLAAWQARFDGAFPSFALRPLGELSETGLLAEFHDALSRMAHRREKAARRKSLAGVGNLAELSDTERAALRRQLAEKRRP